MINKGVSHHFFGEGLEAQRLRPSGSVAPGLSGKVSPTEPAPHHQLRLNPEAAAGHNYDQALKAYAADFSITPNLPLREGN